jgi:DNA repair protein RecO (recombination protein O)
MTARVHGEPAFVLHSRPYRETSAITDLLTEQHGLVSVVARGVRGPRRQRARSGAPTLLPFTRLVVAYSGRSQLHTLTSADAVQHCWLTGAALYAGLYLNELLLRLVRHQDPHPELFAGYAAAVAGLGATEPAIEPVLRRFEKLLLRECGYELIFDHDAHSGAPVAPELLYRFAPEEGFLRIEDASDPPGVREPTASEGGAVGYAYSGATLHAIAADDYDDPTVRRAAKQIMRRALAPHLGAQGLRSRMLFKERDAS